MEYTNRITPANIVVKPNHILFDYNDLDEGMFSGHANYFLMRVVNMGKILNKTGEFLDLKIGQACMIKQGSFEKISFPYDETMVLGRVTRYLVKIEDIYFSAST